METDLKTFQKITFHVEFDLIQNSLIRSNCNLTKLSRSKSIMVFFHRSKSIYSLDQIPTRALDQFPSYELDQSMFCQSDYIGLDLGQSVSLS